MANVTIETMRSFLSKSLTARKIDNVVNENKINGLLAEVDFRRHMAQMGFGDRISLGGWIARKVGPGHFGRETVAIFPEVCRGPESLTEGRPLSQPGRGLHTICSTFYQIGIKSYFCSIKIPNASDPATYEWSAVRLGTPADESYMPLADAISPHLTLRTRRHNFLANNTDISRIADEHITEEFLKEHLRVSLQGKFMSEISDVDGILWGSEKTYPIEIKEKTAASDKNLGEYFGIDVGPFVKLAYYASKRGNLHSIFVVREIEDTSTRRLKAWWFITFDRLAQFASWNQQGGGTNMRGGASTVVKIPKDQFLPLDKHYLQQL